ncbi:MAG TPA: PASTA domain-containing protein [Candidatus Caccalectryoclostridium excrementigallinarum]|uniref:PASTA domain-containing protein n=1 Tax=Candidatus Caccalectryoclostridium excrementigallinarum TaxID=2840710 RepID=A0A9D1MKH7_9FIRM|nr:PASTA domain-containing protein [Candidatus Caccalectryoclostridium excrementigallinarum]
MVKISHISIRRRLSATLLLITFFLCILSGRLLYVQIINSDSLRTLAFEQWTRDLPFTADRGDITDVNGIKLASSMTLYTMYCRPSDVKEAEEIAAFVSDALDIDKTLLYTRLTKKGVSEVRLCRRVTRAEMLEVEQRDFSGIYFTADSARYYDQGDFLTQLLGFTDADNKGQSGLELQYDRYLTGINGYSYTETDLIGRELEDGDTYYVAPQKGMNVRLTIDYYMQAAAEKAVKDACARYDAKSVSCVMLNADTGAVLAMAQAPSYDLNDIPRDDVNALMENSSLNAVTDMYEPGSTFKILTSAIGLETGATKNSYYCGGSCSVDGQRIRCWRSIGHGSQDFRHGVYNSCNCVFVDVALTAGKDTMYDYFDKFGLGQKTGIDFYGESAGMLIARDSVKNVDLARIGFGQAVAVTLLQLASAVASCINGGYLYRPYVVEEILSQEGELAYRGGSYVKNTTISASTSEKLKDILYGVVDEGSGKNAAVEGYKIGGKTGTAQKYADGAIAAGKYISSFVGFTEINGSNIVCLFLVDEPQGYVYYGSIVAAPYVGEIFSALFSQYDVPASGETAKAEVVMPDITDLSFSDAAALLKKSGLDYEYAGTGKVVYQLPAAGAKIEEGALVYFAMQE